MAEKRELTFNGKPHPDCNAFKEELREDGLKSWDECPLCARSGFSCEVGRHPSLELLRAQNRDAGQAGGEPTSGGGAAMIATFDFELEVASVETIVEGEPVRFEGQQLVVRQLPHVFVERYGFIPANIFVRKCYHELYEIVAGNMENRSMENGAALFTGVPGIGKSLFLLYFLYRYLHDNRFMDKRFALEFARGEYHLFQPTSVAGEFRCSVRQASEVFPKNFLLLCDIKDAAEPMARSRWKFIFSSPSPDRYKETLKGAPSFAYTMPTWSELELAMVNPNREDWYENFVLFGGVPRHVTPQGAHISPHEKLSEALDKKGSTVAQEFFKSGHGTVDWQQNYMLVHINPPVSADGKFQYGKKAVYSFASDTIFQWLVNMHNAQMLAGAVGMFNSGAASQAYGAVSAGLLFEKICLWLKPLDGQCITAFSLESGSAVDFHVPGTRHLLSHDWKKTAQLPVNELIVPRISNLESGDAFYVVQNDQNSYVLVVFQVTVGEAHPVKANGLHDIVLAFPEDVRNNITSKALVFVTPLYGTLDKKQKLHTRKNEEMATLPPAVRGFEQFVYRHRI